MIKAVIFDVDGTILDSMGIWEDAGARYLRSIGKEPEEMLGKILFPMTIEEGAAYIREHYRLSQDISEIIQGVLGTVWDFYFEEAPLKNGVREFLERLSEDKIPVAAATSSEREYVEAAFERLGIKQYFRRIFTCSETGRGKRDPLIYLTAGRFLEENISETWVFEDALYALETAKAAGFRTVGVYDKYSAGDEEKLKRQADIYIKDFTEICRLLHFSREEVKNNENSTYNCRK